MPHSTWTHAVDLALEQVRALTDRAAGKRLGVSYSTVQRWRWLRDRGEEVPEPRGGPRDALLRVIRQDGGAERATSDIAGDQNADLGPLILLKEAQVARLLGDYAPPGEQQDLKADQLELIRRSFTRRGWQVPAWWYEMLRRVDAGEI